MDYAIGDLIGIGDCEYRIEAINNDSIHPVLYNLLLEFNGYEMVAKNTAMRYTKIDLAKHKTIILEKAARLPDWF